MNVIQYLQDQLINKQLKQVEDIFIEALKRKGFEFDSALELEAFVKKNVECYIIKDEKKYFVKGEPFLLIVEDFKISQDFTDERKVLLKADYGSFKFL